jgi:hypothetical protein
MFDFSTSCSLVVCDNYIIINVNVTPNLQLQLVYDLNTYDHAMCKHFHNPLTMTFVTSCKLWFSSTQLFVPLCSHYKSITFAIFCDYYSTINKLITKVHI